MASFDVIVIGSGPGGYVCAIRAAQLGLKTAIVEREKLGGVCLNVGCIPSKAMITAAHFLERALHDAPTMGFEIPKISFDMKKMKGWKNSVCDKMSGGVKQLLKGNAVTVLEGEAKFTSAKQIQVTSSNGNQSHEAKSFVIATGSRPIEIPGFAFDEKTILSSTGALDLETLPKKLAIIGAGYIGLEIGSYLAQLGVEVSVVEATGQILGGVVDPECAQVVQRKLKKNKIEVLFETKAKKFEKIKDGLELIVETKTGEKKISCDKILVTVGRKPNSDQAGFSQIGLKITKQGFVEVNAQRQTSIPGIYAIGDVACQPMLAHKASHEGVMVAEIISGKKRAFEVKTVPAVVFTDPEIASAGLLESEAVAKGYELKTAKFPFGANGRAVSLMQTDGFVKIIADKKTDVVLGIHIVGPEASNMISEAALAVEMGARLQDIALTIHPHPTLGETVMEAAEAALGHAIHIIQKPLASETSAH